jgi:hypothetical protein
MEHTKGGRGIKAPYSTTHLRVPVPIKGILQAIIDRYKETLNIDIIKEILENQKGMEVQQVSQSETNLLTDNEAIEIAQKILAQKKNARVSMEKLLTSIYGKKIVL